MYSRAIEIIGRARERAGYLEYFYRARAPTGNRLGVLDSSFNPPTKAHAQMANSSISHIGMDRFMFLLSVRNADKAPDEDSALAHRLCMMKILSESLPVPCDVCVTSAPYFVDKAALLHDAFPTLEIHMLMGTDTFNRVTNPKYYDDVETSLNYLFSLVSIICFHRYGSYPELSKWNNQVYYLPEPTPTGMSSSLARRELMQTGVTSIVPDQIMEYISKHNLYSS